MSTEKGIKGFATHAPSARHAVTISGEMPPLFSDVGTVHLIMSWIRQLLASCISSYRTMLSALREAKHSLTERASNDACIARIRLSAASMRAPIAG